MLAALVLVAAAAAATIVVKVQHDSRADHSGVETSSADVSTDADLAMASHGSRPVYPYSIVAGGVYSREELRAAIARDAVVAAHYTDVSAERVRVERAHEPRRVYMSYRVNHQVYWTKNKMALTPGEAVLTDGESAIRARCGNLLSDVPMQPVADEEPSEAEFDRALVPPVSAVADLDLPGAAVVAVPGETVLSRPLHDGPSALSGLGPIILLPRGSGRPREATSTLDETVSPNIVTQLGDPDAPGGPEQRPTPPTTYDPPIMPPNVPKDPGPVAVPEPASLLLVGAGLAGCGLWRLRQRHTRRS